MARSLTTWGGTLTYSTDICRAPAPSATRIVLVGFGWGQLRLIRQLSNALKAARPEADIVWAFLKTETVFSVRETEPQQSAAFVPYDFLIPALNWLHRVDPDVVVFIERAGHPNLV